MKSSEKYKCKICGKEMRLRGFGTHIRSHGITKSEYWRKYPYTYPEPKGVYGEDYVLCPICNNNRVFQFLWQHLKASHNMTVNEFLQLYPDCKLQTTRYSRSRSEATSRMLRRVWMDEDYIERKREYLRENPHLKPLTPEQRDHQRESLSEYMKNMWEDPEYRAKKSEETRLRHQSGELTKAILNGHRKHSYLYKCPDGSEVVLKSSYEVIVADFLGSNGIKYSYEKEFAYYDTIRNSVRRYFADFYLPDYNLVIEVKPTNRLNDQNVIDKMKSVLDSGYNFMFITETELGSLSSKERFEKLILSNTNV